MNTRCRSVTSNTTLIVASLLFSAPAWAEGITPANDGTGTQVTPAGNDHAITGGATSADNRNLFHSFAEFNLLTGESATFFTDPTIQNILSRVTGGNPSFIDGLLQVNGSDANLFFINPNGILFGPNSALNLQGGFTATTANEVNFATGVFGTVGTPDYAALVGTPESFSFNTLLPGSVVNAGNLGVLPGETVVLMGGQVLNTGTITAPGGEILISAVEGQNLVRIEQTGLLLNLEVATLPESTTGPFLPFAPVTLPALLTGNALTEATGVTITPEGTVQLTSGSPVATTPGAVTVAGTVDVADNEGGHVIVSGNQVSLPEGLIDISGSVAGGNLAIYALDDLGLGITVNASEGSQALFDPPTLTVDATNVDTFVNMLLMGSDVTLMASETININVPIDSSALNNTSIFRLADEPPADGKLTIHLNAPITLAEDQTLMGEGSIVNVAAAGSVLNGVAVAASGATVNVAAGTYQEGEQITLTQDITLNGAGAGTILDGNNAHRVVEVVNGVTASINNLTITHGNSYSGGGIQNYGTLTVTNSTISGNESGGGGGINNDGILTIADSNIVDNTATSFGGGIFNITGGEITVASSVISDNAATFDGGGIDNTNGNLTIVNSTISGNTSGRGGGIYNGDMLSVTDSLITYNTATSGGGIYNRSGSSAVISDTTVTGNSANTGGGIFNDNANLILSNSIVTGNTAAIGGEFYPESACEGGCTVVPLNLIIDSNDTSQSEDDGGGEQDQSFAAEYSEHLGVEPSAYEDFDALRRAGEITGAPPALIYTGFVPAPSEFADSEEITLLTKEFKAGSFSEADILAEAKRLRAQGTESDDDVLQIALVTPDGDRQQITTRVTRGEILRVGQQLRRALTNPINRRRQSDIYLKPAQQLYEWLVAPLETALGEGEIGHLSFIMDKGIRSLPLAALHDGEQFIIEKYSVGLMPTLSLTDTRIGNLQNASVLAMGASEFDDQSPLPAVPLELAAIEGLWPGEVYLNESFTAETVLQSRDQTPHIILHLATHAEFVEGELADSYIQFWDERLGLDRLPQLRLGTPTVELLVLSACSTALGSEKAELGFAGLAVKAGAKTAIAALWQVSDLATAGLMAELYTQLGEAPYKADALRQAQLAMLRGEVRIQEGTLIWNGGQMPLPEDIRGQNINVQHPYFWSGFTLVGNPW